ncbi:MAG: hypothetical protein WEB52_15695 [Dehalococcoidia bacterium]
MSEITRRVRRCWNDADAAASKAMRARLPNIAAATMSKCERTASLTRMHASDSSVYPRIIACATEADETTAKVNAAGAAATIRTRRLI